MCQKLGEAVLSSRSLKCVLLRFQYDELLSVEHGQVEVFWKLSRLSLLNLDLPLETKTQQSLIRQCRKGCEQLDSF